MIESVKREEILQEIVAVQIKSRKTIKAVLQEVIRALIPGERDEPTGITLKDSTIIMTVAKMLLERNRILTATGR